MLDLLEVNFENFGSEMCDKVFGNLSVVLAIAFGDASWVSVSVFILEFS